MLWMIKDYLILFDLSFFFTFSVKVVWLEKTIIQSFDKSEVNFYDFVEKWRSNFLIPYLANLGFNTVIFFLSYLILFQASATISNSEILVFLTSIAINVAYQNSKERFDAIAKARAQKGKVKIPAYPELIEAVTRLG
jgi:anaerobic C4-dicarboxylate transporter